MTSWLSRLGLGRPELRAWALYDWANSAFMTTIIAAIFPVYFMSVAATGLTEAEKMTRFSFATTVALITVAVLGPFLGAVADCGGLKKKMLAAFLAFGVLATAAMVFIGQGQWVFAAALFIAGNIGVTGSFVFYDSLLPHVARPDEMDRVSSAGYALGYLGGGLLLAINVAWMLRPHWFGLADANSAARLSFLSVAVWWLVFSIPMFLRVPEPPTGLSAGEAGAPLLRTALRRLGGTLRELRSFRNAFLMILAFVIYNDGINTIIRLATAYGSGLGLPPSSMVIAILLVQFIGIPFAFLFGWLAGVIGAKRSVFLSLLVYTFISLFAYRMTTTRDFYVLAILVGTVQGGSQALSRSLFASMIPRHKSSEFFAFFGVFEKFAGILGPALFGVITALTNSGRGAILSVIAFFALGGALLTAVDVGEGQRAARRVEEEVSGA